MPLPATEPSVYHIAVSIPLYQVDAFSSRPFAGNPAAVCFVDEGATSEWMQAVALENNLSETAFLTERGDGWGLRWFTPRVEVDLCGHATLASAHVLWETGRIASAEPAIFHTRSGRLTCERSGSHILMDFPAAPATMIPIDDAVQAALGAPTVWQGLAKTDLLVELENADTLRAISPDLRVIRALPYRGIIVTAKSDAPKFDFLSRFFAPAVGVDEDPVTGSAHCALAPYWSAKLGKDALTGFQASARGGVVTVGIRGDRVSIGGQAVTVFRGELFA